MSQSKKNWKRYITIGMVLVFSFLLTACGGDNGEKQEEEKIVPVEITSARMDQILGTTHVKGTIAGATEVNVMPKMAGKVSEVRFAVGDSVQKGQVLFRMETTEVSLQLQQAEAGLQVAEAAYADAKKTLERTQTLFNEGAASQQQLEQAQLNVESKNPASTRASVQLLREQVANATVKSPINGIVTACNVKVGEFASQQMPSFVVVDMNQVVLKADVTEQYINDLAVGQEVAVLVESAGSEPFAGVIDEISPAAGAQTKTYPIKIKMDNKDHIIKPGMFAEADIVVDRKEDVVVVPKSALIDLSGVSTIFVNEDGVAKAVAVEIGIQTDDNLEILSGIAAGDQVIIKGQYKLSDGMKISITEAESK